ncbi:DUF4382 domain-containing protein [Chitinophaga sp. S165]|uniref:DUF4382 domain-containing protein n=1 Tax=Chitinophaga sp. S165 TaxID=2135462 RepID=UPI000D708F05|nr:DUF4382 domain-containing protein [Chitinophaga sp. S165]PWV51857.1 carboxypeptidase family protein [Chitinophaga sp. S165]
MKTYLRTTGWGLAALILLAFAFHACQKDNSTSMSPGAGQQRLSIYFADNPGYFDNVFLDIRKVEVLVDTCTTTDDDGNWGDDYHRCWWWEDRRDDKDTCQVWDSLGIRAGVYDVLSLRNGTDTLLGDGIVPEGKVKKIRITLGDNNYLVKDSTNYPLKSPSGQVRIVIQVRHSEWEEFSDDNFRLWLDFDVDRSIIQTRQGQFILRPVIHVFTLKQTGSISGKVTPWNAYPVITVYNDQDTSYALPWKDGQYKLRGLKAGTYNLFVNASNGYKDTTITGITVSRGENTKVEGIKLNK